MRLRLFVEWRQKLEGPIVPAKKNKRGSIVEERSSSVYQDEGEATHQANKQPHGGILMPPPYGGILMPPC
jgi:hypothetical protein